MRVLLTTQPGLGHLHPLVPVADGLRTRGHEVLIASSRSFASEIEAAGHHAVPMGIDWVTSALADAFPDITGLAPGPARYDWARSVLFADRTARASVPDLLTIAERSPFPTDGLHREQPPTRSAGSQLRLKGAAALPVPR